MNIHLRDDRIKAIVPVMVAFDENKLTVQPLFELSVFIDATLFPAFKDKIAEKENSVLGLDPLVMLTNNRFIHFFGCLKRPLAISDDIEV